MTTRGTSRPGGRCDGPWLPPALTLVITGAVGAVMATLPWPRRAELPDPAAVA
jgi:hypothetical protein